MHALNMIISKIAALKPAVAAGVFTAGMVVSMWSSPAFALQAQTDHGWDALRHATATVQDLRHGLTVIATANFSGMTTLERAGLLREMAEAVAQRGDDLSSPGLDVADAYRDGMANGIAAARKDMSVAFKQRMDAFRAESHDDVNFQRFEKEMAYAFPAQQMALEGYLMKDSAFEIARDEHLSDADIQKKAAGVLSRDGVAAAPVGLAITDLARSVTSETSAKFAALRKVRDKLAGSVTPAVIGDIGLLLGEASADHVPAEKVLIRRILAAGHDQGRLLAKVSQADAAADAVVSKVHDLLSFPFTAKKINAARLAVEKILAEARPQLMDGEPDLCHNEGGAAPKL